MARNLVNFDRLIYFNKVKGLTQHSSGVGRMAYNFSRYLELKQPLSNDLLIAGYYHDIGKCLLPIEIINKPEKLNKVEFEIIKLHPVYSYDILKEYGYTDDICNIVKFHHEEYTGTGYPYGLKGQDIPIGARILKLCDVYDALTHSRVYKHSLDYISALSMMEEEKFKYDPDIYKEFFKFLSKIPYMIIENKKELI